MYNAEKQRGTIKSRFLLVEKSRNELKYYGREMMLNLACKRKIDNGKDEGQNEEELENLAGAAAGCGAACGNGSGGTGDGPK